MPLLSNAPSQSTVMKDEVERRAKYCVKGYNRTRTNKKNKKRRKENEVSARSEISSFIKIKSLQ